MSSQRSATWLQIPYGESSANLDLDDNPHHTTIDADHFHFEDVYLAPGDKKHGVGVEIACSKFFKVTLAVPLVRVGRAVPLRPFNSRKASMITANGGKAAEILYSIMAGAKANQVEPFACGRDLLVQFSGKRPDDLSALLPDAWLKTHPDARRRWSR